MSICLREICQYICISKERILFLSVVVNLVELLIDFDCVLFNLVVATLHSIEKSLLQLVGSDRRRICVHCLVQVVLLTCANSVAFGPHWARQFLEAGWGAAWIDTHVHHALWGGAYFVHLLLASLLGQECQREVDVVPHLVRNEGQPLARTSSDLVLIGFEPLFHVHKVCVKSSLVPWMNHPRYECQLQQAIQIAPFT